MARSPLLGKLSRLFKVARRAHVNAVGRDQLDELTGHAREAHSKTLSRREFLAGSAAVLSAFTLPQSLSAFASHSVRARRRVPSGFPPLVGSPVAIVGAGLAGLTAALHLRRSGIPCFIFEADSICGGRVSTGMRQYRAHPHSFVEMMTFERGGEFIDFDHEEILQLCFELGVEPEEFGHLEGEANDELFFSHGKFHSENEILRALVPLAREVERELPFLTRDGRLFTPGEKDRLEPDIVRLDNTSLGDFLSRIDDKVELWLLDLIRHAYTCEFGLEPEEQSLLAFLLLWDTGASKKKFNVYGTSDESLRIRGGSGTLIDALERALPSDVPIYRSHALARIDDFGTSLRLWFHVLGRTIPTTFSQAIMALPFTRLRHVVPFAKPKINEITFSSVGFRPAKRKAIKKLGYGTNGKLVLGFKERFWRKPDGQLPPLWKTFYGDKEALPQFWEASRGQAGKSGLLTCHFAGRWGANLLRPDTEYRDRALLELDCVNRGPTSLPFDGFYDVRRWAMAPYHFAGYSSPHPGQYTELLWSAGLSEGGDRLFFVGEHTEPELQGFMNGAVRSGIRGAREIARSRSINWTVANAAVRGRRAK